MVVYPVAPCSQPTILKIRQLGFKMVANINDLFTVIAADLPVFPDIKGDGKL